MSEPVLANDLLLLQSDVADSDAADLAWRSFPPAASVAPADGGSTSGMGFKLESLWGWTPIAPEPEADALWGPPQKAIAAFGSGLGASGNGVALTSSEPFDPDPPAMGSASAYGTVGGHSVMNGLFGFDPIDTASHSFSASAFTHDTFQHPFGLAYNNTFADGGADLIQQRSESFGQPTRSDSFGQPSSDGSQTWPSASNTYSGWPTTDGRMGAPLGVSAASNSQGTARSDWAQVVQRK